MYKVRWRGYGPSWDTWEPYENLQACVDMIEAYLERQKQLKLKKKEHSKKVSPRYYGDHPKRSV